MMNGKFCAALRIAEFDLKAAAAAAAIALPLAVAVANARTLGWLPDSYEYWSPHKC